VMTSLSLPATAHFLFTTIACHAEYDGYKSVTTPTRRTQAGTGYASH
jgi:hypothetical protein